MAKYHKYVFDTDRRSFVGNFEEMYRQESVEKFDSWHQEDSRQMNRKIALSFLDQWNFEHIVDIGAGKGAFTHLLKKNNNLVSGLDISPTAVEVARERYPDVEFTAMDINNLADAENYFQRKVAAWGKVDLTFSSEAFSYLSNWQELLAMLGRYSRYLLISLYIPENPIGFVKSEAELLAICAEHFTPIEEVSLRRSRFTVILGESRLLCAR